MYQLLLQSGTKDSSLIKILNDKINSHIDFVSEMGNCVTSVPGPSNDKVDTNGIVDTENSKLTERDPNMDVHIQIYKKF